MGWDSLQSGDVKVLERVVIGWLKIPDITIFPVNYLKVSEKKKKGKKNMGPLVIHSSQGEGGELVLERSIGYLDG